MFANKYGDYSVGDIQKLNKKYNRKQILKNINWEKVFVYGVCLGFMISTLYLLLKIMAVLTA